MGTDSTLAVCKLRVAARSFFMLPAPSPKCKSEILVELQIALIVKIVPSEHLHPAGGPKSVFQKNMQGLPDCLQATMALESRITRCRYKPISQSRFS